MALILHIDTSVNKGSICLSDDDSIIDYDECLQQKDQSAWLHPAIQSLLLNNSLKIQDLHAISVVNGPGSYTGLRIGLAAAKGICYALKIPIITISTLQMMASVFTEQKEIQFICPMIDARRLEVYTAVYNPSLEKICEEQALILDENSFSEILKENKILFCGNGVEKWQSICKNENAAYSNQTFDARNAVPLAYQFFLQKKFADLAYVEPNYLKQVYIKS